jgi:hypothetical protein
MSSPAKADDPVTADAAGYWIPRFPWGMTAESWRGSRHFCVRACLKYLESGGAWSFLVGIRNPSPLRK